MSFNGTWNIVMQTPMGNRDAKLTLSEDGGSLSGTMAAEGQDTAIENAKVEGGTASWDVNVTTPMPLTLSFKGEKDGDDLNGTVQLGMFGSAPFTGTPA